MDLGIIFFKTFVAYKQSLGEIVKVGNEMSNYSVGQFVVIKCAKMRAYSEYLVWVSVFELIDRNLFKV